MALVTGWFKRGGANGGVTDADGRQLAVDPGGLGDATSTSASVSAPGAGGTVIAIGSLTTGAVYKISGTLTLTGTAETALVNARLTNNGSALTGGGLVPTLTGIPVPFGPIRVTVAGTIGMVAVAAATAGSIYTANLVIQRVE